jgi:hypothetical protein
LPFVINQRHAERIFERDEEFRALLRLNWKKEERCG